MASFPEGASTAISTPKDAPSRAYPIQSPNTLTLCSLPNDFDTFLTTTRQTTTNSPASPAYRSSPSDGAVSSHVNADQPSYRDPSVQGTNESARQEENTNDSFVNLETVGLRRSPRLAAIGAFKHVYGMLAHATCLFTHAASLIPDITQPLLQNRIRCYQSQVIEYHDYLDSNFGGSLNHSRPMAQIYLTTQTDNGVYILK